MEAAGLVISTLRFITSHPLNRTTRIRAIGRYVWWQISSRFRPEIEYRWINDAKLLVKHGMTGATGNIYCGLHEFVEMSFLLHLLRPGDLFLDIGANIGSYTVLASKVCGARSIAFEPDPVSAEVLRRNIGVNALQKVARVEQTALGFEIGEARFTIGLDTVNHIARQADSNVRLVPIRRLDHIADATAPTLIKLDVEGFEEQVLAGAGRVLAAPSLLAIQSESASRAVSDLLGTYGFRRVYYDPFKRELSDEPYGYRVANTLFVRDIKLLELLLATAIRRMIHGVRV